GARAQNPRGVEGGRSRRYASPTIPRPSSDSVAGSGAVVTWMLSRNRKPGSSRKLNESAVLVPVAVAKKLKCLKPAWAAGFDSETRDVAPKSAWKLEGVPPSARNAKSI